MKLTYLNNVFESSGIGYHTVQQLAIRGARVCERQARYFVVDELTFKTKVYLAARNETRAYAAIARMKREGGLGTGSVDWLELDLSSPRKSQVMSDSLAKGYILPYPTGLCPRIFDEGN